MIKEISAISLLTFKEGLKHRIIYGVIIFSILAITFNVIISGYFLRDIQKILVELSLSVVSLAGLSIPFFLTISLISGDLERRSAYTILASPLSRGQYLFGKFFGLSSIALIITTISSLFMILGIILAMYIFPAHFFETFSFAKLLVAVGLQFLGLLLLNSMVILWCCVTTSAFLATLLCFASYFIGHTCENMLRFMLTSQEGAQISPFVKKIVETAMYVFPNLSTFDFKKQAAYGLIITTPEILFSITYAISYIIIALSLAIFVINRRNLP